MFKLRINIFIFCSPFLEFCTYMRGSFPLFLSAVSVSVLCAGITKKKKEKKRKENDRRQCRCSRNLCKQFSLLEISFSPLLVSSPLAPPPKKDEMMNRVTQIREQAGCLGVPGCAWVCVCVVQTCLKISITTLALISAGMEVEKWRNGDLVVGGMGCSAVSSSSLSQ